MSATDAFGGKERRQFPRIEAVYLISFVNHEGGIQQTPISMGRTLDISPAGAKLEVYEPVAAGSEMELQIALSDSCVHVRGRVAHVVPGTGGKFIAGVAFSQTHDVLGHS